jgi:uncharacterized protein YbcI
MDKDKNLKQKILQVSERFFTDNLAMNPGAIEIDIHSDCLVLTLQDVFSKAEKEYVLDEAARDRLERFYKFAYGASKIIFESAINNILPDSVTDSVISIHPETGKCIIVVSKE